MGYVHDGHTLTGSLCVRCVYVVSVVSVVYVVCPLCTLCTLCTKQIQMRIMIDEKRRRTTCVNKCSVLHHSTHWRTYRRSTFRRLV